MFTGALTNTDTELTVCMCQCGCTTSSWTLILLRNISNRPEHSHLPPLCPSICLPSFFLSLFNHLMLYQFPIGSFCNFFAFKVVFFYSGKGLATHLLFYFYFFHFLLSSFCLSHHLFFLTSLHVLYPSQCVSIYFYSSHTFLKLYVHNLKLNIV